MGEQMTVRQALEETMQLIGNINVPVSLKEQIADPLRQAWNNIGLCVEAIARADAEQAERMNGGEEANEGGQSTCSEEPQIEEVGG